MQPENLRFQIRDLGKINYFGLEGNSYDIAGNTASIMISNEKGILCFLVLKHLIPYLHGWNGRGYKEPHLLSLPISTCMRVTVWRKTSRQANHRPGKIQAPLGTGRAAAQSKPVPTSLLSPLTEEHEHWFPALKLRLCRTELLKLLCCAAQVLRFGSLAMTIGSEDRPYKGG